MELKIANHSFYPRFGESHVTPAGEDQLIPEAVTLRSVTLGDVTLRKALHLFDRKKIDHAELNEVYKTTIRAIIKEQDQEGLDVVTDGLIWWNDPVSHFMKQLEGVSINGLLRFFDTNFYFRQPVITGPMRRKSSCLKHEISFLKQETTGWTKAVLTGPYTLACLSKIQTDAYSSPREVADVLTTLLAMEIEELSELGVDVIQIDEPCYVASSDGPDWGWAGDSLAKLADRKGNSKIGVATYFGDALAVYSHLQKLPVDYLGVDCTYSPKLLRHIQKNGSVKELALGLLDGRNTKLENPDEIVETLKTLESSLGKAPLSLTTSCGLEYLPRESARNKLNLLNMVKRAYKKG